MYEKTMKKIDKALILSDAVMCYVLNVEANAAGVTLEEYVDRFLEVIYNKPQELYHLLNEIGVT